MSLNTAVMTGSRIFGPALAALLLRWVDPGWLFIINGVSFAAILWPIWRIDTTQLYLVAAGIARRSTGARGACGSCDTTDGCWPSSLVVHGHRYVRVQLRRLAAETGRPEVRRQGTVRLAAGGHQRGEPDRIIDDSGARRGSAQRGSSARRSYSGVSGFGVAWAPSIWVAYLLSLPLGAGGAAFIAALNAISQQESPPDMRGRLLALGAVAFLGTTPIGAPITGWIADHISAEWSLAYGSVIALVSASLWVRRHAAAH